MSGRKKTLTKKWTPRGGERLKKKAGRSDSSRQWLKRQLNDPYVQKAKAEGYRSRAAYKLLEIDEKYKLFQPGQRVIDLGSAPGGWSQVAASMVSGPGESGHIVALDLLQMEPIEHVEFIQLDFMADDAIDKLCAKMRSVEVDGVISDMAANTTGHRQTDHLRTMALVEAALEFAAGVLAEGGYFIAKVLRGGTEAELLNRMKLSFGAVRHFKPPASRKESTEVYVIATNFRKT